MRESVVTSGEGGPLGRRRSRRAQAIRRGSFNSVKELIAAIGRFIDG